MMDGVLNEQDRLAGAQGNIERYIQLGRTALQELYEDRSVLKVEWLIVVYTASPIRCCQSIRIILFCY